jgi:poly-gamma-glutamate synthesis protein (capsule biosynthesis protein)
MIRIAILCLLFVVGSGPRTAAESTVVPGRVAAESSTVAGKQDSASEFTMALTGDSIITRALSVYEEPGYLEMIERIRGADVAFTNLEVLLHDYEVYPAHQSGGTWMRADPKMAEELVWAGFDLVSMANNHTGDYGIAGMRLTIEHVREAGLVYAGVGESLAAAREAKFLETSKARVALVSAASTFTPHSVAGRSRGDIPPRPGLSPLRFTTTRIVTPEAMAELREAATAIGQRVPEDAQRLRFLGETFVVGESIGRRTTPNERDVAEIAAVVRNASQLADYVIVTLHAHESGAERMAPAHFIVAFAHAMIDAGADVVTGHGPHVLRGIEIYEGKPIFYSLGDFLFQNETLLRLPDENYQAYDLGADAHVADFNDRRYAGDTRGFPSQPEIWESVIAMPTFRGGELVSIELHPISLQFGAPSWVRGRPLPADEELSTKILEDLIRISAPFGTTVQAEDGVGIAQIRE